MGCEKYSGNEKLKWRWTKPLGECVYTVEDQVALLFGIASLCIWSIALLPQIITTCRVGSVENVSQWFWFAWLLGDTCNVIGCFLVPDNIVTNTALACVYLFFTIIGFSQVMYFKHCAPVTEPSHENENKSASQSQMIFYHVPVSMTRMSMSAGGGSSNGARSKSNLTLNLNARHELITGTAAKSQVQLVATSIVRDEAEQQSFLVNPVSSEFKSPSKTIMVAGSISFVSLLSFVSSTLTQSLRSHEPGNASNYFGYFSNTTSSLTTTKTPDTSDSKNDNGDQLSTSETVGLVFGWICGCIYVVSRLPQIAHTLKLRDVSGLSPVFFSLTFLGNLMQFLSMMIVKKMTNKILIEILPWLVGSGIAGIEDLMLVFLIHRFQQR